MCVTPYRTTVSNGPNPIQIEVPCNYCWACLKNRQNDLIGRGLAEAAASHAAWFVTLTYDDRKIESREQVDFIQKRDFQNFIKRLRAPSKKLGTLGYKLKYITAGEVGPLKGRTHFHAILFWHDSFPPIRSWWNGKQALDAWPWGHCDIDVKVNERSLRYVVKYLTKGRKDKAKKLRAPGSADEWLSYSKKPILGADFIKSKAARQAAIGVLPYDLNYMPPGGNVKNRYSFYGAAQEMFFDTLYQAAPQLFAFKLGGKDSATEWVRNSLVRWKSLKADKNWRSLDPALRLKIVSEMISGRKVLDVVTNLGSKLTEGYERYDRLQALMDRVGKERYWQTALDADELAEISKTPYVKRDLERNEIPRLRPSHYASLSDC